MNRKAQQDISRKLKVLNYVIEIGKISCQNSSDILESVEKHFIPGEELIRLMVKMD